MAVRGPGWTFKDFCPGEKVRDRYHFMHTNLPLFIIPLGLIKTNGLLYHNLHDMLGDIIRFASKRIQLGHN